MWRWKQCALAVVVVLGCFHSEAREIKLEDAAANYKNAYDAYYKQIVEFRGDMEKDTLGMASLLKLRLYKWAAENCDSFSLYFKHNRDIEVNCNEFDDIDKVYKSYITDNEDLFTTRLKQTHYQAAAEYFKANPYYYRYIAVDAYGQRIKYFDAKDLSRVAEIYHAEEWDYDFVQEELVYKKAPGVQPDRVFSQTEYYRVVISDSRAAKFMDEVRNVALPVRTDELYRKVYTETLDQTQEAVLDFRMNLIKYCYGSLLSHQGPVADIFPSIQSTTRIYNPKLNKCIGMLPYTKEVHIIDCGDNAAHVDWYVMEVGFKQYAFRSMRDENSCLENDASFIYLKPCNRQMTPHMYWRIDWQHMAILGTHGVMTYDNSILRTDPLKDMSSLSDNQIWTATKPHRNYVFTGAYYKKSHPTELIRNFPKLLRQYIPRDNVQEEKELQEFFSDVKQLGYFDLLPGPIQRACAVTQFAHGRVLFWLTRLRQEYERMRASLVYYPKAVGTNVTAGEVFVYDQQGVDTASYVVMANVDGTVPLQPQDPQAWSLLGKVGNRVTSYNMLQRYKINGVFYKGDEYSKPGDMRLHENPTFGVSDVYEARVESNATHVRPSPKDRKSDIYWHFIRGGGDKEWSGKLALASFVNSMNSFYLRSGMNMIRIQNPAISSEQRYIKPDQKDEKALGQLLDDSRSILEGSSPFNLALYAAAAKGSELYGLGELIGLSRLDSGGVQTIPTTPLFNNSAVVSASEDLSLLTKPTFANGTPMLLPMVTTHKVKII